MLKHINYFYSILIIIVFLNIIILNYNIFRNCNYDINLLFNFLTFKENFCINYDNITHTKIFSYNLILLFLIFFFILVRTLNFKSKIFISLFLILLVPILLISEILLFLILQLGIYKFDTKYFNYNNEKRVDLESHLNEKFDEKIYPPIFWFDIKNIEKNIFPFGTISDSIILSCNENNYYSYFKTDKYGFRNENKIWNEKKLDILIVGDSQLFNDCSMGDEHIVSKIKNHLNHFQKKNNILNLSHGGASFLTQYASIKEYAQQFKKINNILFFLNEKSLITNYKSHNLKTDVILNYLNPYYLRNLNRKQKEINLIYKKNISYKKYIINKTYNFINFISLSNIRNNLIVFFKKDKKFLINNEVDENTKYNIEKTIKNLSLIIKKDTKVHFVFLPNRMRYGSNKNIVKQFLKNQKIIKSIIKSYSFNYIDISDIFKENNFYKDAYSNYYGLHYNDKAKDLISNVIMRDIYKLN